MSISFTGKWFLYDIQHLISLIVDTIDSRSPLKDIVCFIAFNFFHFPNCFCFGGIFAMEENR